MKIYVIIPARSGSKGVPNKNIRKINGKELIGYSIEFAKRLQVDKIICSTDSAEYAEIAKKYGAEVPFLRSEYASSDTAKDEDVLKDVYDKFDEHNIEYPDLWVWLRPTFIFRDLDAVKECIDRMKKDKNLTACRIVTEAESRIYSDEGGLLKPNFDDKGLSTIPRQSIRKTYRVFNTDVFRGKPRNDGKYFLGGNVGYVEVHKICALDIDDEADFLIVSRVAESSSDEDKQKYCTSSETYETLN